MDRSTKSLGSEKIGILLLRLSLPATVGMICVAMFNVVDTIMVGRGIGTTALAAVSIIFPIQMIIMAIAQTIGTGAASLASRSIGAANEERALKSMGNAITMSLLSSALIFIFGYIFRFPLLSIFGAKATVLSSAENYFTIVLAGSPLFSLFMVSNNLLRAEGKVKPAMTNMILSGIANIVLDYIFIFILGLGIKGAAAATVISQGIAVIFVIFYYGSGRTILTPKFRHIPLKKETVREILSVGVSAFARQSSNSLVVAVLNNSLIFYGGTTAVAVFGIVHRVLMLIFMPMFGVVQGFLPIAGYNYGCRNYTRVLKAFFTAGKANTLISISGFLLLMIFPGAVLSIFSNDPELLDGGSQAIRLIVLFLPIVGYLIISAGLFQAIGKALPSFLLSMSRQVFFMLPLVIVLPFFFNLEGIWLSFPIADLLTGFITIFLVRKEIKILSRKSSSF